ncbi:MAG: hypothetical protein K0S04_851 [Herbinix sp.]|jgi:ABC-type Fe3+-hydroxamate transport system substrate-binding protein|nr:hypothetical protein [Herbinix sp.]
MKIRKLLSILLILITLLSFSGCSSGFEIGSVENSTSTKITMSYYLFSGVKTRKITVEKDKPVDVAVEIESEGGSLDLSITDEKGNSSYQGQDLESSSFLVTLSEEGTYTLQIEAKKHKGSFDISW